MAESSLKVCDVTRVRRLGFQRVAQDRPIDNRTIGDDSLHARIKRAQDGGGSSEAPADYENLLRGDTERRAVSHFRDRLSQPTDDV